MAARNKNAATARMRRRKRNNRNFFKKLPFFGVGDREAGAALGRPTDLGLVSTPELTRTGVV
jgi:hypothetical protein